MVKLKSITPDIEVYIDNYKNQRGYYLGDPSDSMDSFGRNAILILIDRMPYMFEDQKTMTEMHYAYRDELMRTAYKKKAGGSMQMNRHYYPGGNRYGYINEGHVDSWGRPPIFMMYPPKYIFNFNNGDINVAINREKFSLTPQLLTAMRNKITIATECYVNSVNSDELKEFRIDGRI